MDTIALTRFSTSQRDKASDHRLDHFNNFFIRGDRLEQFDNDLRGIQNAVDPLQQHVAREIDESARITGNAFDPDVQKGVHQDFCCHRGMGTVSSRQVASGLPIEKFVDV